MPDTNKKRVDIYCLLLFRPTINMVLNGFQCFNRREPFILVGRPGKILRTGYMVTGEIDSNKIGRDKQPSKERKRGRKIGKDLERVREKINRDQERETQTKR